MSNHKSAIASQTISGFLADCQRHLNTEQRTRIAELQEQLTNAYIAENVQDAAQRAANEVGAMILKHGAQQRGFGRQA